MSWFNDGMSVLERDEQLAALRQGMDAAATGGGSLVLVSGEAGVGKTTLVRRFAATLEDAQVVTGVCDPLPTPSPLGPLLDMAPGLGLPLEHLLAASSSGRDVAAALLQRLASPAAPLLLVFEDVHWADQATLELIGFLGRRVERLRALIIATFRQEELAAAGPLTVVLGDLATAPGVRRLTLAPLSRDAVGQLARGTTADVDELYRTTGGNPFFVTEVLGARSRGVPQTVRDAVLARVARRSSEARQVLDAAAAIGARIDPALLGRMMELTGTPRWSLQEAVNAGLLERQGSWLAFRHELAQAAIVGAMPPEVAQRLHASILSELQKGSVGPDDHATLVRHAEAAGDDAAVAELAPLAAARAAALGAHREAAQLYGKALERTRDRPRAAELLERRGEARYASRQMAGAMEDHRAGAHLCRELGDRLGEARNLVRISYLALAEGDHDESRATLDAAASLLEGLPPSREQAIAYELRARVLFMANEPRPAETWAVRAAALAEDLAEGELALDARITAAVSRFMAGDDAGRAQLRTLREAALVRNRGDLWARDTYARVTYYLALIPMLRRQYDDVDLQLEEGARYADEHELEYWQSLIASARVMRSLDAGRWREAAEQASLILGARDPAWRARLLALIALGRVRARTGQPGADAYLGEAREVAGRDRAAGGLVPPARVEAAWLAGDNARARQEALEAGRADPWSDAELAFWAHLAGAQVDERSVGAEPYRLAVGGAWVAAAIWWEHAGCPYEMAVTLASSGEPDAVRRAIAVLDQLGAAPAAAYARRRLRELGVASVPRGPYASTAANPAGLTGREQEVIELVATGLTNAEIAARLFLSERTVERHLAGIFAKLDVGSRAEAVRAATRAGAILDPKN